MLRFFHKVVPLVFYEKSQNRSRSEQILQKHRYRSNVPIIGASDNTGSDGWGVGEKKNEINALLNSVEVKV